MLHRQKLLPNPFFFYKPAVYFQIYNALYGAFLGKRHPKAFGRDMR
jgi:hypothetical protein